MNKTDIYRIYTVRVPHKEWGCVEDDYHLNHTKRTTTGYVQYTYRTSNR